MIIMWELLKKKKKIRQWKKIFSWRLKHIMLKDFLHTHKEIYIPLANQHRPRDWMRCVWAWILSCRFMWSLHRSTAESFVVSECLLQQLFFLSAALVSHFTPCFKLKMHLACLLPLSWLSLLAGKALSFIVRSFSPLSLFSHHTSLCFLKTSFKPVCLLFMTQCCTYMCIYINKCFSLSLLHLDQSTFLLFQ